MTFIVTIGGASLVVALLALGGGNAATETAANRHAIGRMVTRPVASPPFSDRHAARLVHRSPFEPRPDNRPDNHRMPTRALLAHFRAQNAMPYKGQLDGHFTGTTDEIIQWAAIKHGLAPDLLRAVAVVESYWHMSLVGDNGDSFGVFQVRRPYHCVTADVCAGFAHDTALNADYYAAIIRAYFDGRMDWLTSVSGNGRRYRAGDIWGSVGAWYSGRWHSQDAEKYIAEVKQALTQRTWRSLNF
jgi:hypothetical protein